MDTNRRDALKLGASAAMSGMFISNAIAAPDVRQPIVVEPMTGKTGFRVANYLPKMGASSRLGLVTNDGLVVDIPSEASRQKCNYHLIQHQLFHWQPQVIEAFLNWLPSLKGADQIC